MLQAHNADSSGKAKRKTHTDGKDYYVLPVVAVVEGVLNGTFVPASAIEKFHESWNGRPVPVGHPQIGGSYVSANSLDIVDRYVVGQLWNVSYKAGKLRGEIWVDIARAQGTEDGRRVIERVESGKPIEVSTAYWMDARDEVGEFKGKHYSSVAESLGPDHLALLLDEQGACNWQDGCGTPRVNKDLTEFDNHAMVALYVGPEFDPSPVTDALPKRATLIPPSDRHITLKYLGETAGSSFNEHDLKNYISEFAKHQTAIIAKTNGVGRFAGDGEQAVYIGVSSPSLMQFREALCRELSMFAPHSDEYGYTPHITVAYVDENTAVDLIPPPPTDLVFQEIVLKWGSNKYTFPLQGYAEVKEEVAMAANTDCGCKNHEEIKMTEEVKTPVANAEETIVEVVTPVVDPALAEVKELLAQLKALDLPSLKETVASIKANADQVRAGLVAELTANSALAFTKDDLAKMDTQTLTKLAQSVRVPDYSGRYNVRANSAAADGEWEAYVEPKAEAQKETK